MSTISCCSHCQDAGNFFNDKTARKELKRYRKKGPPKSTRLVLSFIYLFTIKGKTLLDIGGGIGAIQHELFKGGLGKALQVEASQAYIEAAEEEAERNGNKEKVESYFGDFVERASDIPGADIVTMDRVLCCYPHLEELINTASSKCGNCCGVVYPREKWFTKLFAWLGNLIMRIRRKDFRIYIHPEKEVSALFHKNGLRLTGSSRTSIWKVEMYSRS